MKTLNVVFSSLSARRRYEVWFIRLGLADGDGAWWFRYLLMNPGRCGCPGQPRGRPVQVWATWFPRDGTPQSFIQEYPLTGLDISPRGQDPFHFRIGNNGIEENSCRGALELGTHSVFWNLRYRSTFQVTLSSKGWIGFSKTPHSDALISGQITLDGRRWKGDPLGLGVQGHNCGYRHRKFWRWAHAYFLRPDGTPSTFEALVYEMPFGLLFRKAVLWHNGKPQVFRNLREARIDQQKLHWDFRCFTRNGVELEVALDGSGIGMHRLPYAKTDCAGNLQVVNNSLGRATLCLKADGRLTEKLETMNGAVLEMGGSELHSEEQALASRSATIV
jgi:hypothetical protein